MCGERERALLLGVCVSAGVSLCVPLRVLVRDSEREYLCVTCGVGEKVTERVGEREREGVSLCESRCARESRSVSLSRGGDVEMESLSLCECVCECASSMSKKSSIVACSACPCP